MDEVPFFRFSCFWGMIIWTEGMFSVLGIGWSRMQMHRITFYISFTRSFKPHFMMYVGSQITMEQWAVP
jgi:hypothetical protein